VECVSAQTCSPTRDRLSPLPSQTHSYQLPASTRRTRLQLGKAHLLAADAQPGESVLPGRHLVFVAPQPTQPRLQLRLSRCTNSSSGSNQSDTRYFQRKHVSGGWEEEEPVRWGAGR
jgi:hypothetical protein